MDYELTLLGDVPTDPAVFGQVNDIFQDAAADFDILTSGSVVTKGFLLINAKSDGAAFLAGVLQGALAAVGFPGAVIWRKANE